MRTEMLIRLLALAVLATPASACAQQFRCDAPSHDEWMTPWVARDGESPIAAASIVTIDPATAGEAIGLLQSSAAVELDSAQFAHFAGAGSNARPGPGEKPYLVRAVFPSPNAIVEASWFGDVLRVSAGALGCAPFLKHPVILLLNRVPVTVDVQASAAL